MNILNKALFLMVFLCTAHVAVNAQENKLNTSGNSYYFLFSEHSHDRVCIADPEGKIIWEHACHHPQDVCMLPGKKILVASTREAFIVDMKSGEHIWSFKKDAPNEIPYAEPWGKNFLVGVEGENTIYEINEKGEILGQTRLTSQSPRVHATFRFIRRTGNDSYIVPFCNEKVFKEVNLSGEELRTYPMGPIKHAVSSVQLPSGNVLLGAGSSARISEMTPDNEIVWELTNDDMPDLEFRCVTGLQLLKKEDILVVANYSVSKGSSEKIPQFFAIDRKTKEVVWRAWGDAVGNIGQVQLLNKKMKPLKTVGPGK